MNFVEALKKAGFPNVEIAADSTTLHGYLSTGNLALNYIISGKFSGGWPLGHVGEIFGDPSTGKSYLLARAIAEALKADGVALLDDTENAFNAVWASMALGVDVSRLARASTHTVEEHFDLVMAFVKAIREQKITAPSILALDSLALLSTKEEVEGGMEKLNLKRAQVVKKALRLMAHELFSVHAAYLIANHTIANIGDIWNPTTTGGGSGVKFQSTVRLELRVSKPMKDANGKPVGVKVTAKVVKNRLVPPYQSCDMIIPFYEAISPVSGLITLLADRKFITKTAGHRIAYKEGDTKIPFNASDFWKQDQSALELVSMYPEILSEVENTQLRVPTEMVEVEEP